MKYRKKPVVVEAERFTQASVEAHLFDRAPLPRGVTLSSADYHPVERRIAHARFFVTTIQGRRVPISPGEWIISEGDGEHFYPCASDVFEQTYEPADPKGKEHE